MSLTISKSKKYHRKEVFKHVSDLNKIENLIFYLIPKKIIQTKTIYVEHPRMISTLTGADDIIYRQLYRKK
jgi:uncharacterized membrane protein